MNLKTIVLLFSVFLLLIVAGCGLTPGKSIAGQAVAGFSDAGCVEGPWVYMEFSDGAWNFNKLEAGCTEKFADLDENGKAIPWCATKTTDLTTSQDEYGKSDYYENVYVSGNGYETAWKECSKEESQGRGRKPIVEEMEQVGEAPKFEGKNNIPDLPEADEEEAQESMEAPKFESEKVNLCPKVEFEDTDLEESIKVFVYSQEKYISPQKKVTKCDAEKFEWFYSLKYYKYIDSLKGLEAFSNLKKFSISFSLVSDLTPLQKLTKLESLDLTFNKISDISALKGLTKLKGLHLEGNQISDLSALSTLKNLNYLVVGKSVGYGIDIPYTLNNCLVVKQLEAQGTDVLGFNSDKCPK